MKKIMIKACEVRTELYNCSFLKNLPGVESSIRMIMEKELPTNPDHRLKSK
jgi:hypothetical protein